MTQPLTILDRCACGVVAIHREPCLSNTCTCGRAWLPARRALNSDWTVRLVANRLRRIRDNANATTAGRFDGISEADTLFCERILTAACADRWHTTVLYGTARDLLTASLHAAHGRNTRSATAYERHRRLTIKCLDSMGSRLHAAGIARS